MVRLIMGGLSTTLSASVARANFYQLLEDAANKFQQFTITLRGRQRVVMMSAEEFAGWQETLEILSDKKLAKSVKSGLTQIGKGRTVSEKKAAKILGW